MRAMFSILLFLLSFCAMAAEEAVIQVRPVVEVEEGHAQIVLGDLIVAHGVSTAIIDSLRGIRLADAPKNGESRTFTSLALEQIFREQLRLHGGDQSIALRIPPRISVLRKSFRLELRQVEEALREQLKGFCADCVFDIQRLTLPVLPPSIPADSTWAIRLRHDIPKGNFSLPLEVTYSDTSKRTYWLTGALVTSRRVPVAARAIAAGENLGPQDFNMQLREITFATDRAADETEIIVSVAGRAIAAGEILWRNQLKREPLVKFGDLVKVTAGAEGWQISVDGIAQGSGVLGEAVRVKINRTQKLVSGTLTGRGVVEVR